MKTKKEKIIELYSTKIKQEKIAVLLDTRQKYVSRVIKDFRNELGWLKSKILFVNIHKWEILTITMSIITLIQLVFIFFPSAPHQVLKTIGLQSDNIFNLKVEMEKKVNDCDSIKDLINITSAFRRNEGIGNAYICKAYSIQIGRQNSVAIGRNFKFSLIYPSNYKILKIEQKKDTSGNFRACVEEFTKNKNSNVIHPLGENPNPQSYDNVISQFFTIETDKFDFYDKATFDVYFITKNIDSIQNEPCWDALWLNDNYGKLLAAWTHGNGQCSTTMWSTGYSYNRECQNW